MKKTSFILFSFLLCMSFPAQGKDMDISMNVHLGNIRAVVSQNDSIEEINHYYPYGSLFGESTGLSNETQPYKYTGKELDRMHGLDLHDHGARWSDTNIGRWHKVDRYAEKYYPISPYSMCGNNPTRFLDLSGDTLQLKGSEADVTTMITTINTGLGGYYTTSIDKNGIVSITPVEGHNNSKMSNAERVFLVL